MSDFKPAITGKPVNAFLSSAVKRLIDPFQVLQFRRSDRAVANLANDAVAPFENGSGLAGNIKLVVYADDGPALHTIGPHRRPGRAIPLLNRILPSLELENVGPNDRDIAKRRDIVIQVEPCGTIPGGNRVAA